MDLAERNLKQRDKILCLEPLSYNRNDYIDRVSQNHKWNRDEGGDFSHSNTEFHLSWSTVPLADNK